MKLAESLGSVVLDYRLRCLEYTSTIGHLLHTRLKWAKSIWRYLVCKHLSDSNFFPFVLKFNYGCIWIEINGDHFSPTDGGLFECALMIISKPLWGEGGLPGMVGSRLWAALSFSRTAVSLPFQIPAHCHHMRGNLQGADPVASVDHTCNDANTTQYTLPTSMLCMIVGKWPVRDSYL